MIPPLVHHMWLQGWQDSPRSQAEVAQQSWGSNVQHMFWDEAQVKELIAQEYPEWLAFYQRIPTLIVKCDVSRAFVMHKHGGVYADVDLEPSANHQELVRSIEPRLNGRIAVVSQISQAYILVLGKLLPNNNWMACEPAHPFWLSHYVPYIQSYLKNGGSWRDVFMGAVMPTYHVFATSGPVALLKPGVDKSVWVLDFKTSRSLARHPPFKSTWIQYRALNRHIIVMSVILVLAAYGLFSGVRAGIQAWGARNV